MNTLIEISHETMVFMRGKYRLDEVGDGRDELKFKQGAKTILTIYTREDKYIFLIIFGKKEREIFESRKDEFSQYIKGYYEKSKTYHDGKWMFIEVTTLEQLKEVKKLIVIKKKPNRKPFPKEGAVYSRCGHRCDLCIHYTGISEELRQSYGAHVKNIWFHGKENPESDIRCGGCGSDDWYRKHYLNGSNLKKVVKGILEIVQTSFVSGLLRKITQLDFYVSKRLEKTLLSLL